MAEGPHVYYRRVRQGELATLLEEHFGDKLEYVLFERIDDIGLIAYSAPDQLWLHARAFGENLELRWTRREDGYDLNLLTEAEMSLEGGEEVGFGLDDEGRPMRVESSEPTEILLWGTHSKYLPSTHIQAGGDAVDGWIETRIPRPLRYPVEGAPAFVKISAINYKIRGQTLLTRMKSVQEGTSDG